MRAPSFGELSLEAIVFSFVGSFLLSATFIERGLTGWLLAGEDVMLTEAYFRLVCFRLLPLTEGDLKRAVGYVKDRVVLVD